MKTREELWAIAQPMIDEWVKDPDLGFMAHPADFSVYGGCTEVSDETPGDEYVQIGEVGDVCVCIAPSYSGDAWLEIDEDTNGCDAWWEYLKITIDKVLIIEDTYGGHQDIEEEYNKEIYIGYVPVD